MLEEKCQDAVARCDCAQESPVRTLTPVNCLDNALNDFLM
jgi:hypothetical protein